MDVATIQRCRQELGYYTGTVDGQHCPLTTQVVRAFQSDYGLAVDGLAGPRTQAALGEASSGGGWVQYTVVPGDTLVAIAKRHGSSVQAIYDANDVITDVGLLEPGWCLDIPVS